MKNWQTIETAPKDRAILLAVWDTGGPYYVLEVGWWEDGGIDDSTPDGFWSSPCAAPDLGMHPTHWMELPKAPEAPEGAEE